MNPSRSKTAVTPRQIALAAALAATLAATWWVAQREEIDAAPQQVPAHSVRPTRPARAAASVPPPPAPGSWARVERTPWPEAPQAQFAAWGPPPPPPAPPAPPPPPSVAEAPVAPAFPYQLIGRLEEGGVSLALLSAGNRSLNAKAGDVIDGQWRVERVGPTGLGLLWLPGQQPQTITFRPSS
jgi:type IV secretory pathway VirB10-like protein